MNPAATHMLLLYRCLQQTSGPILEMGSGWYSTALVSAFAVAGRYARTYEDDPNWFAIVNQMDSAVRYVRDLRGGRHDILLVDDYGQAEVDDRQWDVVFLDHNPPARRGVDAARLRQARIMIGHDSDHPDYGYEETFQTYRHRRTLRIAPHTTVVSHDPLDWLDAKDFD